MEELLAEVERLRAENAHLQSELTRRKQKPGRKRFPMSRTLALLLIVVGCSAAVFAPVAVWARRSFLETDNFVKIAAPLSADRTVANALSNEVASRLFVQLQMRQRATEALQEALPDKLDFMAELIAQSLQTLTQKVTFEIITSQQFQTAWDKILRFAHSNALRLIRSDGSLSVRENGDVVLDTRDLMTNVRSRLAGSGMRFLQLVPIPARAGDVVLFTSSQLGTLKASLDILDTLNWLLPLLALVAFTAAVFVHRDRRRILMWICVAIAAAMLISMMLLNIAERELLEEVRNPNNISAVRVIWDRMTGNLVSAEKIILALGIAGALAFAVAGPYAWACWTRRKAGRFLPFQVKRQLSE